MTRVPSYTATLNLYWQMSGREADTHWKALLRIATASESTWRIFEKRIDLWKGHLDVESLEHLIPSLSHGETLLVSLALNLFRGYGSTDIATLAEQLDPNHWQAATEAIQIYRAGFAGSPAQPVQPAQAIQNDGVSRVALVGSLTTQKLDPSDIDFLLTVSDACDLAPLALEGRRLKGRAQSMGRGADIFLANPKGQYIGRTCSWKDCRPFIRLRCEALHCGERPHLYDDFKVLKLASSLVKEPPLEVWPKVVKRVVLPADVEDWLAKLRKSN